MHLAASVSFSFPAASDPAWASGLAEAAGRLASLAAPGLRLLTGPRSLLRAGVVWTLARLPAPSPLVVVDGGESVGPDLLAEVASHLGEAPRALAARVHVARAETPHQVVALVEAAGADAVQAAGRHTLILAPLDLLGRDDLPPAAEARLLARLVAALEPLGRAPRSAVVVCPDLPVGVAFGPRAAFVARLAALADAHLRFDDDQPAGEGGVEAVPHGTSCSGFRPA